MKKVALIVGHNKKSQGAVSQYKNVTEYQINKILVKQVQERLNEFASSYKVDTYIRDREDITDLIAEVNITDYEYVLEFHLNSFQDVNVRGSETLYWHSSQKGKQLAEHLLKSLGKTFPKRDILPIKKGDRGWQILKLTKSPAIIIETCFISNHKDLELLMADLLFSNKIADNIANGIARVIS